LTFKESQAILHLPQPIGERIDMNSLRKLALRIPAVKRIYDDLKLYKKGYPPGHYYSPLVSVEEIASNEKTIFSLERDLHGISLNKEEQVALLHQLQPLYNATPYLNQTASGLRYYFNNNTFEHSDAIFLQLLIRHLKPRKIIEIGSGFSSAVMLDTNELFFSGAIQLTFIEPYAERLKGLMKPADLGAVTLLEQKLQDVSMDLFAQLGAGDILFVDSTHVSKTGSDVNKILFEILPVLPKGVIIHFHDIFFPFEYPKEWVLGWSGFGWNEIYLLRAFLTDNEKYRIILFNTYLEYLYEDWFKENMPLCLKDRGGSIWLTKAGT
jgi:predicted O-methyltransferase YrrM